MGFRLNMPKVLISMTFALPLLAIVGFFSVQGCNEAVCASIVSKCMLTQSCKCELRNCTCCKECFSCLDYLYAECCSCVGECFLHIIFLLGVLKTCALSFRNVPQAKQYSQRVKQKISR